MHNPSGNAGGFAVRNRRPLSKEWGFEIEGGEDLDRALLAKRDRLVLEAKNRLHQLRPNTAATAREIDAEVQRLDLALHAKWAGGQDLQRRISTILRIIREERSPRTRVRRKSGGNPASRSSGEFSPVWIVGRNQRDDLRPDYSPVPPEHEGSFVLQLLNRGSAVATDIELRIGSVFKTEIPLIDPGERGEPVLDTKDSSWYRYSDLLGGTSELSFNRFSEGPGKEFRHLVKVRYRYGGTQSLSLNGELWGNSKRYFYRFKPERGRATPIY